MKIDDSVYQFSCATEGISFIFGLAKNNLSSTIKSKTNSKCTAIVASNRINCMTHLCAERKYTHSNGADVILPFSIGNGIGGRTEGERGRPSDSVCKRNVLFLLLNKWMHAIKAVLWTKGTQKRKKRARAKERKKEVTTKFQIQTSCCEQTVNVIHLFRNDTKFTRKIQKKKNIPKNCRLSIILNGDALFLRFYF